MRNRAWRRAQNDRIIQKRKNIIKNVFCGCSASWDPEDICEYAVSGRLRKHNLTCDCWACKIGKAEDACSETKKRQKGKDYERIYCQIFRSNNFRS